MKKLKVDMWGGFRDEGHNIPTNGQVANAYNKRVKEVQELRECLAEAVDLMEDVRVGAYKPDSCTTQPWKRILSDNGKDIHE